MKGFKFFGVLAAIMALAGVVGSFVPATPAHAMEPRPLTFSKTYDPASLIDGAGATTTVTLSSGVSMGDYCLASFGVDLQGITVNCYISAANVASVRFQNESGGTLDLASSTLRVLVFRKQPNT